MQWKVKMCYSLRKFERKGYSFTMKKKYIKILAVIALSAIFGTGCGAVIQNGNTKVVFTTGFSEEEVFRIDNSSCWLPEVMVYLMNTKNQYELAFGSEIWDVLYEVPSENPDESSGTKETLEENIKETVLARIARIKALNLLAREHGIALSTEERSSAKKAAERYFSSLNDTEKELLGVNEKILTTMYEEYALSGKVYKYLIADINPEISDDEARTITVQYIMIKTYSTNGDGERVPYATQAKNRALQKVKEALGRAKAGEDFMTLIAEYNEDSDYMYSFGKGVMEKTFEETAFNLGTNEISDIIETEQGYYIIKCISAFDREETDRNKVKIVEQRRKEVFNEEYAGFVESLTKNINQELWDSIGFIEDENVRTSSFFAVYQEVFVE